MYPSMPCPALSAPSMLFWNMHQGPTKVNQSLCASGLGVSTPRLAKPIVIHVHVSSKTPSCATYQECTLAEKLHDCQDAHLSCRARLSPLVGVVSRSPVSQAMHGCSGQEASLSHETLVGTLPRVLISAAVDYIISLVFFYFSALRDNALLVDIGQISRDSPLGNTHLGRLFERRPHLTAFKAAYCYHAFELLFSGGKQLLIREFFYSSLRVSAMTASFTRHAACPLLCLRRPSRHLSCAMLHAVSCVAFAFNALGAVSNAHLILVDSSLFFGNNMVTGPSDIYFS